MEPLRLLIVDDSPEDADLVVRELRRAGFSLRWSRVQTEPDFREALREGPDIIVSDYFMPGFSGLRALELLKGGGQQHLPFILISGTVGEEEAVQAMRAGATDYLLKDRLVRLPSAVQRALMETQLRAERAEGTVVRARLASIVDSSEDAIIGKTLEGTITNWNRGAEHIFGYSAVEAVGQSMLMLIPADRVNEAREILARIAHGETVKHFETVRVRRDGVRIDVSVRLSPIIDAQGRIVGVSNIARDITEQKRLEDQLFVEKDRAQVTLHSIGDAVISTDASSRVTYLNAAAERLTGWPAADAAGRPLCQVFNVVDAASRASLVDSAANAMSAGHTVTADGNRMLLRRNGSELLIEESAAPIHQRDGRVTGAVIVFRDVSATRAMLLKMAHLAHYDVLTNLANRSLVHDRITQAVALSRRHGTTFAVLFVDLDRFKRINDSMGHTMGDALLQSVTSRLLSAVRGSDTVSRHGGDEFVVLLPQLARGEDAARPADKILAALAAPHQIADHTLHLTASVGISVYPGDGEDVSGLISAADAAMYRAKETGRNNRRFFTPEMNARRVTRSTLENGLREALSRGEFRLHYQPKVDLQTSRVTGVEALLRWQHPERGLVAPGDFVAIAEECGLILPIGQWVLREACRQAQVWQTAGLAPTRTAVNVSAIEFLAPGFLEGVEDVLRETGLGPEWLEFEVTESVLMADVQSTTRVLRALKDRGVSLAIDDFGTGYSSLSYLTKFPIDTLKIDRSFIHTMTPSGDHASIVEAIIGMGRSLKLCVIAEGVETAEQLTLLQALSCREGQGFYFGRPVDADQFAGRLPPEPRAQTGGPQAWTAASSRC
jgi:diguanylate cyclase (GGDEF)-like protein/PAS domain S-box-containing protein